MPSRACLAGAEIVQGSFEDDASLARAVDGVDTMLLAGRDGPDAVSQHRRVLEHARRAGVSHVVKLSENGASAASPISLMRAAGLPAWRAFDLAHVAAAYAAVDHDVSPDLESLLGRRPRALAEFLADHGDAFRPAHS